MPDHSTFSRAVLPWLLAAVGCFPVRDLDQAAAGETLPSGGHSGSSSNPLFPSGGSGSGTSTAVSGVAAAGMTGGKSGGSGVGAAGAAGAVGTGAVAGIGVSSTGTTPANGGEPSVAVPVTGHSGGSTGATGFATDLPDIANSPIDGEIRFSEGASWTINAVDMPTVEVHTPVASYWLLKAAAGLVSITDRAGRQWIGFNANRPRRGLPALGVCCELGDPVTLGLPVMTTVLDTTSQTSTHVRFVSKSSAEDVQVVWDFFLTHLTITLNRMKTPYGFTYRGVPGGLLETTDLLRLPDGTSRGAMSPWLGDLPGPAEWAYFADPIVGQSLFLIRHGDDALEESYQIADGDSAKFTFANSASTVLPSRFSIGILGSTVHSEVADRVQFVVGTVH